MIELKKFFTWIIFHFKLIKTHHLTYLDFGLQYEYKSNFKQYPMTIITTSIPKAMID